MPKDSNPHPITIFLVIHFRIFLSYTSWLSGCFLCPVIPINALYAFLVCTVPCPINDKETNSRYDLRNMTSPFLDFPTSSAREFILQSGLFDDIVVGFGQDKLDIELGVGDNRFILLLKKRKGVGLHRNGAPLPKLCLIVRLCFKNPTKFVLKFPGLINVKNVGLL
jgi:hypothetical protein